MSDKEMRIGGKHFCKRCQGYHGTALNECRDLNTSMSDKTVMGYASCGIPMESVLTWEELTRMAKYLLEDIALEERDGMMTDDEVAIQSCCRRILAQKEEDNGKEKV